MSAAVTVIYEGDKVATTWTAPVDLTDATAISLERRELGSDTVVPMTGETPDVGIDGVVTWATAGDEPVGQHDVQLAVDFGPSVHVTFGVATLTVLPRL